jgi:hypothetical protein
MEGAATWGEPLGSMRMDWRSDLRGRTGWRTAEMGGQRHTAAAGTGARWWCSVELEEEDSRLGELH